MKTEFGNTLEKALENKDNNINYFVWKNHNGSETRLMDMNPERLQEAYDHTISMLYNNNNYTPGKEVVRKNLQKVWEACNAEIFKRFLLYETDGMFKTNKDLLDYTLNAKQSYNTTNEDSVTIIMSGVPVIYENISIGNLLDACFDKLGVFNKKLIPDNFIVSQGIWLTNAEKAELTEYKSDGTMRKWLDVIKERLFLKNIRLRIDPKGFSYSEFRSLIHMDRFAKISELPTDTLKLLRDKVLLLLDNNLVYSINTWNTIKKQIEQVAEYKDIVLISKDY